MVTIKETRLLFLLDELPSRQILKRFAAQYPNMEIDSVFACLHVLKLASVIIRELEAYFGEFDLSMARFIVWLFWRGSRTHS